MNIPKPYLFTINQLFEIEQKVSKLLEKNSVQRNIDKLRNYYATEALSNDQGLTYHNPIDEKYNETRTDCDATITGDDYKNLVIIEVLKPIIYLKTGNSQLVVQKAIVIVKSKN